MSFKDWLYVIGAMIAIVTSAGSAVVWAADKTYVRQEIMQEAMETMRDSMQMQEWSDINKELRFLEIKKSNSEATASEIMYIDFLKQEKEALEKEMGK